MAKKKVTGSEQTDLMVQKPQQELSIEAVIQSAIANKTSVDVMERLLAMRTQLKQERAKEAYNESMAAFQAECPTIVKTKEVYTNGRQLAYKYAPIESIVSQVKDLLQKHGFSYSTGMELLEGGVKVKLRVTHSEGHSEEFNMEVPFGTKTSVMSQTQVAAAATTFAKRYAFCNAFGILTGDEDTDAKAEDAQKDRMPSYQVARVVADESDEAGGYRGNHLNQTEPPFPSKKVAVPPLNSTNDAHGLDEDKEKQEGDIGLKIRIANLLSQKRGYVMLGKTQEEVAQKVMDITGIKLAPYNYGAIIEELESL